MKTVLQNVYLRNTEVHHVLSPINNATDSSKSVTYMAFALTTTDVRTTSYFNKANSTNFFLIISQNVAICPKTSSNRFDSHC
jgi:hypothetical protein